MWREWGGRGKLERYQALIHNRPRLHIKISHVLIWKEEEKIRENNGDDFFLGLANYKAILKQNETKIIIFGSKMSNVWDT